MTVALLALAVTVAAYAAASLLASAVVAVLWRIGPVQERVASDALAILALRLFPTGCGLLVSLGLALPAFLASEPQAAGEAVGAALPALTALLSLPILLGFARGALALRASRRLLGRSLRGGRRATVAGAPIPVYEVDAAFPAFAVAGVLRPRLLIAAQVRAALTSDQLASILAHESNHVARGDNLRQLLMRSAPDWLPFTGVAGAMLRAWCEASERSADDAAVGRDPAAARTLAAALVAVARLTPRHAEGLLLAHAVASESALKQRVLRLVAGESEARRPLLRFGAALALSPIGLVPALAALTLARPELMRPAYDLAEALIQTLL